MKNIAVLLATEDISSFNQGAYVFIIFVIFFFVILLFISKKIRNGPEGDICKEFYEIINGHHENVSFSDKKHLQFLFVEWQMKQIKILNDAPDERYEEWNEFNKINSFLLFKPSYLRNPPGKDCHSKMKIFMKDVFTEPFSLKGNDGRFIVLKKFAYISTFKGISLEDSSKFFIYIKNHFSNNKMAQGEIVQFDIYYEEK